MKLLLIDRTRCENLTASKINRLFDSASLPRRRPSVIEGHYFAFALTREEAELFQEKYPSPLQIQHVYGSVDYLLGTMPSVIRNREINQNYDVSPGCKQQPEICETGISPLMLNDKADGLIDPHKSQDTLWIGSIPSQFTIDNIRESLGQMGITGDVSLKYVNKLKSSFALINVGRENLETALTTAKQGLVLNGIRYSISQALSNKVSKGPQHSTD